MGAPAAQPTEYEVKAAYLFNFAKFVTWPGQAFDSPNAPLTICIAGPDKFGASLDSLIAGERIGGRPIAAKRIAEPGDMGGCHIVFVGASEAARARSFLDSAHKRNALTVSDMPHFAERGGMIQFVLDGGRVRFDINLKAAQDAGLALSSELLKVAGRVMPADKRDKR